MSTPTDAETSVKVAVRARPQNAREQIDMCRVCTSCMSDQPQIVLGKDKAFTYDFVFDTFTEQAGLYQTCVENLVSGCFSGYNATVLAYGQTGSGKTYTMGTGFDMALLPEEQGVIPRAVSQIFNSMEERRSAAMERDEPHPQFELTAQFLELYNEEIIDLFDANRESAAETGSGKTGGKKLRIHEEPGGNIYVAGATELRIESEEETLACLKRGALSRSVGSTNMNAQSSRSHAIFTLHIVQQRPCSKVAEGGSDSSPSNSSAEQPDDWETLSAKFHFVDLAGSERLKRTGATGERAKEGISINCGLLALGNVISALGDKMKRGSHVPYRDSKLTRLLQDSLGGNSQTLMIACISPTDRDFMETLNTLKYANRARNIKNKVVVNQDKASQQLAALRAHIQQLEVELQEFRSGRMVVSESGSVVMNDMASENTMLRTENDKLRMRVKAMQQVIDTQSDRIAALAADKEAAALGHQDESTGQVVSEGEREQSLSTVIQGYLKQIEELKSRLVMSESLAHQSPRSPFRRAPSSIMSRTRSGSTSTVPFDQETQELLETAWSDIQRLREKEERKVSVSEFSPHSVRRRARSFHNSPGPVAGPTSVENEEAMVEERPATLYEVDEESNSSNEDLSDGSEEEDGSDSSDDSDSDLDEAASLASSVAELSSEINLKQQLVDQLEKAQRSLYTMKQQYEDKMQLLQQQIRSVESERDKVLKDITSRRGIDRREENVKEVKGSYERQLADLRSELKSLKTARKEHAKAMRKNAQHEMELKRLKQELLEMKKQRVKMLNRMRSEANQKKVEDARRSREMAQLKKETRKKEHRIKSLEADAKKREIVLRRRADELAVLRRRRRFRGPLQSQSSETDLTVAITVATASAASSSTVPSVSVSSSAGAGGSSAGLSGAVVGSASALGGELRDVVLRQPVAPGLGVKSRLERRKSSVFSSDSAKRKWRLFERKIMGGIVKRKTTFTLSQDMDRWIEQRDQLSRKVEELKIQRKTALRAEEVDVEELKSVDEDLDSLSAHIDYVQENIVELQNDLIAIDDSKGDGDTVEAHAIITACTPREAKYLLEHLLDMTLSLGVKAEQQEAAAKSLEARLQASEQTTELIKTFSSPQVSLPFVVNTRTVTKIKRSPQQQQLPRPPPPVLDLDGDSAPTGASDLEQSDSSSETSQHMEQQQQPPQQQLERKAVKLRRRTGLPSELAAGRERPRSEPPVPRENTVVEELESPDGGGGASNSSNGRRISADPFERKKRPLQRRAVTVTSLEVPSPTGSSTSPPSSRRVMRTGNSEGSVWTRLATNAGENPGDMSKGSLQAEKADPRKIGSRLLTCTHTACGHSAGVLSVSATQHYLFSASQDRTVKVWNLKTCTELLTLDKHFSYVRSVRFCPRSGLIFTASQSLIKIWDMRNHRARCIKTFGPPSGSGSSSSDTVVQDLLVSPESGTLFSASGNFVNIWDLRKFMHSGRLVGHNGAVCALTMRGNLMITGSRDRFIKLYDMDGINVQEANWSVQQAPVCTLYPPHYDAVSSFATHKDFLFSACGVTIKQWDIKEHCLKQAVDGAHSQGSTITSLGALSSPVMPLLVSGCKGGLLKLWSPETCNNIGEVVAHKNSINAIATNDTCIFTGSSDKTIKIWRPSPFQDT